MPAVHPQKFRSFIMSEEKNTNIQQSSSSSSANSASKKSSLTRRVWKVAKWVLLSLLFLIILIPILLYIPFIQRFAIDKASEWLSEETGMEVSVGKFSLGFPLDLEMGDVLAVENGDTVLFAENLEASVQLLPLLSGKVVVDKVQLDNTHLHTKDLIASMRLDGHVGSLTVRADSIDLSNEFGRLNHIGLRDTDLTIAMADSVPEDTTVSEPTKWKFQIDDLHPENVKLRLQLAPQADSTQIALNLGDGHIRGTADLGNSLFSFPGLTLENSSVSYRSGSEMDLTADFEKLGTDASLNTEKGSYKLSGLQLDKAAVALNSGSSMSVGLNSESIRLNGDIDLATNQFAFTDIALDQPRVNLDQHPDMTLAVDAERITLDSNLDMNTSVYHFTGIELDNPDVSLNQGRDMDLSMKMQRAALDGHLNMATGEYDFQEVSLHKPDLALRQGRDMSLDLSMDQAYLNGKLNMSTSNYGFDDIILRNSSMKMRQGKNMSVDVSSAKTSLNANLDLNNSVYGFDDVRMSGTDVAMKVGKDMNISSRIGKGSLNGKLDMNREQYTFSNIALDQTDMQYDNGIGKPSKGFDASHIAMKGVNSSIAKAQYSGDGSLELDIRHLSGQERSGLTLRESRGRVKMDNRRLALQGFDVQTPSSSMKMDFAMDMNAFDSPVRGRQPGKFDVNLDGTVGKQDMALFLDDLYPDFQRHWPSKNLRLKTNATGNLQNLQVKNLEARMDGVMDVKGNLNARGLDSGNLALTSTFDAKIHNTDFVKSFVDADKLKDLNLPSSIALAGNARYDSSGMYAKAHGHIGDMAVNMDGTLNLDNEDYDFIADLKDFRLRDFLPKGEHVELTGYVAAKGHGFDPYAPTTTCSATLDISRARYEQYELQNINGTFDLFKGDFDVNMNVKDPKLMTSLTGHGTAKQNKVKADLDLDLGYADLQALGLYDGALSFSTKGKFNIDTDLDHLLKATARIDDFNMVMDGDSLTAEYLDLYAETTNDTTVVDMKSDDLSLEFFSPNNILVLADKYQQVGERATRFAKQRMLNINLLKRHLPEATLKVAMGNNNPASRLLQLQGITFKELKADLTTDSITGVKGLLTLDSLSADSIQVETARIDILQDTTAVTFGSFVKFPDQERFDGFSANLDGYVKMDQIMATVRHRDSKGDTGLNLGMLVNFTDSGYIGKLIPEKPILAYDSYQLNDDNVVILDTLNRLFADVHLRSLADSCRIDIAADPKDANQDITAHIQDLNIGKISALIPSLTPMEGIADINATYKQDEQKLTVSGDAGLNQFVFDGTKVGDVLTTFSYEPLDSTLHQISATASHNGLGVFNVDGTYDSGGEGSVNADVKFTDFPLSMTAPFIPDQLFVLDGTMGGALHVGGPLSQLNINGELVPDSMVANSDIYSLKLRFEDSPITVEDSRISFNDYKIYAAGKEPLTLRGWFDMSDMDAMEMNLSLYGKDFNLMNAPRTKRSMVFGKMDGDFFARVNGTFDDLRIRGLVKVLPTTELTYIMANTPLSVDYRMSDIVTFVDFDQPPPDEKNRPKPVFSGLDMLLNLVVENGSEFHCEFSADRQSYIDFEGEGSFNMSYTPQGTISLIGRYTIDEGEMKYTLPVIPLKTFTITPGSYVEFTGNPGDPMLNFSANEETTATVSSESTSSRSVKFKTGLDVKGTLNQMELLFTIDAPEDVGVRNELETMSMEERNKLAVAMLCTGMYLSANNSSSFDGNNALNNFLQNEINNIAGKALSTTVDVNMGLEQTTRDDGTTRTDYSFRFSRRFFNNRLNVIVGGKVSSDGNASQNESGAYIDDVSLEWRLDNGGNRFIRLFHEMNYENMFEGQLISNGVSYIFRKKLDKLSDLWKKKSQK